MNLARRHPDGDDSRFRRYGVDMDRRAPLRSCRILEAARAEAARLRTGAEKSGMTPDAERLWMGEPRLDRARAIEDTAALLESLA
jgi:hypothetical protein